MPLSLLVFICFYHAVILLLTPEITRRACDQAENRQGMFPVGLIELLFKILFRRYESKTRWKLSLNDKGNGLVFPQYTARLTLFRMIWKELSLVGSWYLSSITLLQTLRDTLPPCFFILSYAFRNNDINQRRGGYFY